MASSIGSPASRRPRDLGATATLACEAVEVRPVITGTVGLSELPAVLTDLRSGSKQHAKVLVDPTR